MPRTSTVINRASWKRPTSGGRRSSGSRRAKKPLIGAPLLPPVPGQRGAVTPRGHRLQPRQSPAAARLAARHPELAVDQPPAAAVQDRWSPDPACAVLVLQLAQSHLTARLFGQILARIEGLAWR